jgi:hypothetical protein
MRPAGSPIRNLIERKSPSTPELPAATTLHQYRNLRRKLGVAILRKLDRSPLSGGRSSPRYDVRRCPRDQSAISNRSEPSNSRSTPADSRSHTARKVRTLHTRSGSKGHSRSYRNSMAQRPQQPMHHPAKPPQQTVQGPSPNRRASPSHRPSERRRCLTSRPPPHLWQQPQPGQSEISSWHHLEQLGCLTTQADPHRLGSHFLVNTD